MKNQDHMRKWDPSPLAREAEVVLDARLADVWALVWSLAAGRAVDRAAESLGGLLRLAYLCGYLDGATDEERSDLPAQLGLRPISRRRVEPRSRSRSARRDSSDR
jgi:hypothetical protein